MKSPAQTHFMSYLKFHRISLGYTQAEVAARAKIKQATYNAIERGRKKPSPEVHVRLAHALQRPVSEFTAKLYGVDAADMVSAK